MSYADKKIVKNSIFLKIEQGVPHTVRLLDTDPTEQWQHKIDQKLVSCGGPTCFHCNDGHSKNQRFITNVYDHGEGRVMLWSYGPGVAEELKQIALSLQKDGEDILSHDLEVSATGSGLQKKTKVQPRMKSQQVPAGIKIHQIKNGDDQGVPF